MRKVISFDAELIDKIQAYADKYLSGNFNMAVRYFCSIGTQEQG